MSLPRTPRAAKCSQEARSAQSPSADWKHVRGGGSRQTHLVAGAPGTGVLWTRASRPHRGKAPVDENAGETPAFPGTGLAGWRGDFTLTESSVDEGTMERFWSWDRRSLDRKTVSRVIAARGVGSRPESANRDRHAEGCTRSRGRGSRDRRPPAVGEDCLTGASATGATSTRRVRRHPGASPRASSSSSL